MAEIWGAAIAVGGSLISGYASQKKAKEERKEDRVDTREQAKFSGILSQFEKEQDYYYNQLNRANRQRGLDQFKSFSGMTRIDPNYVDTSQRIVVPDKPDLNKLLPEEQAAASGGKKKRSLFDKITDPAGLLGGKASKIADPLGIFG